eukprot:TRINITY_DN17275_c0_g1_i1.p1 TRINITY_DN17275_c0_g1~~TRINITY_DN17275_c0_g1_i1.p1  ORF type:complete len:487 (+),score=99.28 TRINITY_DN17275_c0_g1_i1:63-1463(+)
MTAAAVPAGGNTSVPSAALLLLATGVGTGVLVLPKAMAAVGYVPMIALLAVGSLLSGLTTWLLFLAVAEVRRTSPANAASPPKSAGLSEKLLQSPPLGFQEAPRHRSASAGSASSLSGTRGRLRSGSDFSGIGIVLDSQQQDEGPTFADLVAMVLPGWAGTVLDLMLVIYGTGALVTYFLFLSSFVHEFDFWPEQLTQNLTIVLTASLVFPAACAQDVTKLARWAIIGLLSLSFMSVGVWIREPEMSKTRVDALEAVADLERLPAVGCVCVYAFMWHMNCVCVARDLKNPTRLRCAMVAFGGTTLLLMVYIVISLGGYLSFGAATFEKSSLVDMYSNDDPVFMAVRISMVPSLIIASIVNIYPIRESLAGLVKSVVPSYELTSGQRCLLALILVVFAAATAIEFPNVVAIITLMGGGLATFMMIVFPTIIGKMVLPKPAWLLLAVVNACLSVFLIVSALGLIGKPC